MSEIKTNRALWVDYIKAIACTLVVLGHLFQSMVTANLMLDNTLYSWFIRTIYYFHVPLFFICSGYLYQKYSKVFSAQSWMQNMIRKALALGVPYFTFSILTYLLKTIFPGSVNTILDKGLFEVLFLTPLSPYWYLYVLFFSFVITPTFKSKLAFRCVFIISIIAKLLLPVVFSYVDFPYFIYQLWDNEIWFLMGTGISMYSMDKKFENTQKNNKRLIGISTSILCAVCVSLSIIVVLTNTNFNVISVALGIAFCTIFIVLTILLISKFGKNCFMDYLSKYTLPIFLMHTIFASALRSVLFKAGVHNLFIHIIAGIIVSFAGPIIAAMIMEKTKYLEFFLYPNKLIKARRTNR